MASESKTTTDHKTIQRWVEARGGKPTSVKGTERDGEAGLLRIDFPGYSGGDKLEEISWDEFFKKFDEKNLAFLYQEHTSSGEESRFFKLVSRDSDEHKTVSSGHSKASTADEMHKATQRTEQKANDKTHKTEQKAEHKSDDKARKSGQKADDKAHKAEQKSDSKSHKASTHK